MRVAMISWEYPPLISGGLGIHCQGIVPELTKMGVLIDFYLPTFSPVEFSPPEGMTIRPVQMLHLFTAKSYTGITSWDSVRKFRDRLEEEFHPKGIDLIHAHDWMGVFASIGIAERYKIPLIWTVHSTEYDRAGGMPPNPSIITIEQEALRAANHTIAVSKRTKQMLIDRYRANPDHVTTIYNGIDVSSYEGMANRNYQKTDGHILFLGRVTGQKAPDVFLEAAKLVLQERKNTRFMIVGDGDLLNKLRLHTRRWKIQDQVTFEGGVFGSEVIEYYKDALLFVLPARSEPFGITVLEAMAAGIPTIISSKTGVGEIVENVQVIQPDQPQELAQTILELLNDPALRQTLGQKGAQEARKWSWQQVADETRTLYLQIYKNQK